MFLKQSDCNRGGFRPENGDDSSATCCKYNITVTSDDGKEYLGRTPSAHNNVNL